MILTITPKIILKLRQQGFYPDEMISLYFVLKGLRDKDIDLLDAYDDFNTSKRAAISYQTIFRKGFIDRDKEGSKLFFKLTEKGENFLKDLEPEEVKAISAKDWINEWLALFPEKNHNGVIRSSEVDCLGRMEAFIKKYKYSKEVIIAATKSYIIDESTKGYKFIKRAMFFIDKRSEGSLLAAWCKNVEDNKTNSGELSDGKRTKIIQTLN